MAGNKQAHSLKTSSHWPVIKAVYSGGEKHPGSGNGPWSLGMSTYLTPREQYQALDWEELKKNNYQHGGASKRPAETGPTQPPRSREPPPLWPELGRQCIHLFTSPQESKNTSQAQTWELPKTKILSLTPATSLHRSLHSEGLVVRKFGIIDNYENWRLMPGDF